MNATRLARAAETHASSAAAPRTLGEVLERYGRAHDPAISLEKIRVFRHTYTPGGHEQIQIPEDLNDPHKVLAYTREQGPSLSEGSPNYWVVMVGDGGHRARLFGTFENKGQVPQSPGTDTASSTCTPATSSLH